MIHRNGMNDASKHRHCMFLKKQQAIRSEQISGHAHPLPFMGSESGLACYRAIGRRKVRM